MGEFLARTGNLTRDVDHLPAKGELPAKTRARVAVTNHALTADGTWRAIDPDFYDITLIGARATAAAAALRKGDPVAFAGELTRREYTRTDGSRGIANTVKAQFLAVDLRTADTTVTRSARTHPVGTGNYAATEPGEYEMIDSDLGF